MLLKMKSSSSEAHQQLALQAARESIILLKNQGNLLPLSTSIGSIALIGPSADVMRTGSLFIWDVDFNFNRGLCRTWRSSKHNNSSGR